MQTEPLTIYSNKLGEKMNYKTQTLIPLLIMVTLTGCANMQQISGVDNKTASAAGGAALGCIGGSVLAKVMGKDATTGCAVGAVVGGLTGFEKARQEEIAAAENARTEAAQAFAKLPEKDRPKIGEVKTTQTEVTDKKTNEKKKYKTFQSVTLDIPVSTRGTDEYETAIGKLKTLATRVADERGSAEIDMEYSKADATKLKVKQETASVKTEKGGVITVKKSANSNVPQGIERFTVRAGKIQNTEL